MATNLLVDGPGRIGKDDVKVTEYGQVERAQVDVDPLSWTAVVVQVDDLFDGRALAPRIFELPVDITTRVHAVTCVQVAAVAQRELGMRTHDALKVHGSAGSAVRTCFARDERANRDERSARLVLPPLISAQARHCRRLTHAIDRDGRGTELLSPFSVQ